MKNVHFCENECNEREHTDGEKNMTDNVVIVLFSAPRAGETCVHFVCLSPLSRLPASTILTLRMIYLEIQNTFVQHKNGRQEGPECQQIPRITERCQQRYGAHLPVVAKC